MHTFLIRLFHAHLSFMAQLDYPQKLLTGFGGEAIFMLVVAYTKSDVTALFALILAVGSSGFAISGYNRLFQFKHFTNFQILSILVSIYLDSTNMKNNYVCMYILMQSSLISQRGMEISIFS